MVETGIFSGPTLWLALRSQDSYYLKVMKDALVRVGEIKSICRPGDS